jgi:AraC-like DNA-binding protein
MSRAVAVCHGPFGRVSINDLDRPLVTHAHREAHLILFIEGSRGVVSANGQVIRVDPFMGVAINPWEAHSFRPERASPSGLYLNLYLKPEWLAAQTMIPPGALVFPSTALVVTRELADWRDQVVQMLLSRHSELNLAPVLMALAQAASEPIAPGLAASLQHLSPLAPDDARVARACRLIDDSRRGGGPMRSVARQAGLSRAHFFKLFREQTGLTPSLYANTLRIETALERVALTSDNVTQIGEGLGFSCQSVFTRFFTAHIGMAPSDYRRALRITGGGRLAHV